MLTDQTLLFVMGDTVPKDELRALCANAETSGTRLMCLIIRELPSQPMNAYGALPYGGLGVLSEWMELVKEEKAQLKATADAVEAILQEAGVSGDVQPVHCASVDVREIVAQRAMVSDIATVSKGLRESDPDLFKAASYGVLFESPTSLRLNGNILEQPKKVFLAWNAELTAVRAIHSALPMLEAADEVVIACIDPKAVVDDNGEDPGSDMARWLSHRGCNVTVSQFPSGGHPVSMAIKQRANEVGADLVVMGAFGRSRMRELFFGGTTNAMLHQTEVPVLMAH